MTTMKEYKAAIFDLDGTLLDSLSVWSEVDAKFLLKRGIQVPPDYQHAVKVMNFSEAADYTVSRFGLSESPQAIVAEWKEMITSAYAHEVQLKPRAFEFLQGLRARGCKLAIATSGAPELFLPTLKRCGIEGFFSAIVTTADVGRGKTFPDVYLEAARRLQTPPQNCAVFEDVLAAVQTARAAGFYTVAVRDDFSLHEESALRAAANYFLERY